MLPGGLGLARGPLTVVPIRIEGIETLAPQVQQLGEFLALLLHIIGLQAAAHLAPPVAGIPAKGTQGRVFQVALRQSQLRQQGFPLRL